MDELDTLRAAAAALGIKVDGRWGVDRLSAEVSAAQREPGEDGLDDDGTAEFVDAPDDEEPHYMRAGGHINRGDGRGWVIEE